MELIFIIILLHSMKKDIAAAMSFESYSNTVYGETLLATSINLNLSGQCLDWVNWKSFPLSR